MTNKTIYFATELLIYTNNNNRSFIDIKNLLLFNARFDGISITYDNLKLHVKNNKISIDTPKMNIDDIDYADLELIFKICEAIKNNVEAEEDELY